VITQNADYQKKLDWGYNQEQVLVVPISEQNQFEILRNEINKHPHIINMAGTKHHIGKSSGTEVVEFRGKKYEVKKFEVGENYLETMNMRLKDGRSFIPDAISDKDRSVIINEAFVKNLKLSDPVGTYIRIQDLDFLVVGVVENFHYKNFMNEIEPALLRLAADDTYKYILARVESGTVQQTAEILGEKWNKLIPDEPYDAFYQDQVFELFFRGEDNISVLFSFFALIALVISCMGLFGLASVTITNRMKEIGVRKVLGATILSLLKLINKQFLLLIAISTMIAMPISYLMIKAVIESIHQYHIPISYTHFISSFILIVFTSALTISSLIYRATRLDPVRILKYE
jgi:ABC-type antimicrobial peptide transport system permease subunit